MDIDQLWQCFAWCQAVRPSHSVRPKRLTESGADLITILRCFFRLKQFLRHNSLFPETMAIRIVHALWYLVPLAAVVRRERGEADRVRKRRGGGGGQLLEWWNLFHFFHVNTLWKINFAQNSLWINVNHRKWKIEKVIPLVSLGYNTVKWIIYSNTLWS